MILIMLLMLLFIMMTIVGYDDNCGVCSIIHVAGAAGVRSDYSVYNKPTISDYIIL